MKEREKPKQAAEIVVFRFKHVASCNVARIHRPMTDA